MQTITHEEWLKRAVELFGENPLDWKFICPRCKTVQSIRDFEEAEVAKEKIQSYLAFSCIGRFTEGKKGCDWTLGGLFHIHTLEIDFGESRRMCFEFAEPEAVQAK